MTLVILNIADGHALLKGDQIRDNISDARNASWLPRIMSTISSPMQVNHLCELYDGRTATLPNSVTVNAHPLQ